MEQTSITIDIPSTMSEQYNDVKTLALSYRTLHPKAVIHNEETDINIRIPYSSIFSKYKDYLKAVVVEVDLDEKEQVKYRFKPKTLSQDLYGTTELWDTILLLNEAKSIIDFKPENKIKVYNPVELKSYLDEIIMLEKEQGNIEY